MRWLGAAALALHAGLAGAGVVYIGSSSGHNDGLPTDGSPGALTIARPAGIAPGQALVASIAARPQQMTVTVPSGWQLMTYTSEANGGNSTAPYGMSLITYYKIVTTSEPATYTWTFANPANSGGSAVGGILAFSGIDTSSGNPIDNNGAAWSTKINPSSFTHSTTSINTVTANTMIVSSIAFLSASSFAAPTGIAGLVERLDQSAPLAANALGTTLQMATAPRAATGATGATQAVASSLNTDVDYGIGHLMALQPSDIDPALAMSRGGALSPGGSAAYTMTVTNAGLSTEPGPLTIVDTLPASLGYSSASGSGWACSASGQTVTCSRSGALAAGASAPALTINASVAANATGTLSNSATVSGTGGDANSYNNTAVDSYVIPSPPYAYYALDETNWGAIADASGNGRNASVLGSATPTGPNVPATPGAAIAGSTGTCGAAAIPAATSAIGIDTGIDLNSLGNAGTIMFWYAANSAWNDGTARMLLDASNDLAGGDRHFFLVKDGSGILRFSLKDSAGTTATANTVSYGYPANEWHHIAVAWNAAASSLTIHVDGVLAGSAGTALNGTLGNTATLYVGAQRMSGITGTPSGYTANTANGYLDELRLYSGALDTLEIETLSNSSHSCATGIDHYELAMANAGVACLPGTLTITACTDNSSPCTAKATTLSGQAVTLAANAGTLATATPTFDASGVATTTLSHPNATQGATVSVTLSGEPSLAANPRQCCPNGSNCTAANSCSAVFSTAALIITSAANGGAATIPTQTAGAASAGYVLRAVQTGTSTKACEAALSGATTVNWAYQCNNPTTCSASNLMTLDGGSATTIQRNDNGAALAYTAVPMTFDANGSAPFSFSLADVGQVTLQASKTVNSFTLTGSTNAFVVRPAGLTVSAIAQTASPNTANPAAASATGAKFIKAGESFRATVTATTASGAAAPNFGRETSPEGVVLTPALVLPAGGVAGALANGSIAGGGFSSGAATVSNLAYSEVGIITLTPSLASGSYLGAGSVSGTTTGNIGRFVPSHFALTTGSPVPGCSASFTYFGQDGITTAFTLIAQNTANAVTQNYAGSFAKLGLTSWGGFGFSAAGLPAGSTLAASATAPSGNWSLGTATVSAKHQVSRPSAATAETSVTIQATPVDSDGVTMATAAVGAATPLRYGRLRLSNAFGSARAALQVPVSADYWSGSSWVLNSADSCSTLPAASIALSNPRDAAGSASATTTTASAVSLAAGQGLLTLAAPSPAGSSLSVDLAVNLGGTAADQSCHASHPATTGAARPWLRGRNGSCAASDDRDPAARATFGIFSPESRKTVHVRQIF